MTKTPSSYAYKKRAAQELFSAREKLSHLVQIYNNGQWRRYYKEDKFLDLVRRARQAVDYWTAEQHSGSA